MNTANTTIVNTFPDSWVIFTNSRINLSTLRRRHFSIQTYQRQDTTSTRLEASFVVLLDRYPPSHLRALLCTFYDRTMDFPRHIIGWCLDYLSQTSCHHLPLFFLLQWSRRKWTILYQVHKATRQLALLRDSSLLLGLLPQPCAIVQFVSIALQSSSIIRRMDTFGISWNPGFMEYLS